MVNERLKDLVQLDNPKLDFLTTLKIIGAEYPTTRIIDAVNLAEKVNKELSSLKSMGVETIVPESKNDKCFNEREFKGYKL